MFNQQRFWAAFQVVEQCQLAQQLAQQLTQQRQAQPWRSTQFDFSTAHLHWYESVASTNQTAWELLEQNARTQPIVIARSQTAGRGQWGRHWQSEPDGLYLSIGLNLTVPAAQSAQLTLCTVWGIAIALRTVPGLLSGVVAQIPVQIKWLNDLVLHGRKLGGILTETRIQQGQITRAVIGVGINWRNPVPETGINLESFLSQQSVPLIESLEMLAAITLHGLLTGISGWQQHGIEPILPAYLELLAHRDRPVVVDGQAGTIVGITPTGELRLRLSASAPHAADATVEAIQQAAIEIFVKPSTISLDYPLE